MKIKKQSDVNDCGLVVLQALHNYVHNNWININELKSRAYMNDRGINIFNLSNLAKKYGLILDSLEGSIENLYDSNIKDYLITLIKSEDSYHYVIIKLKKKHVVILDPIKGRYKISKSKFSELYQGIIITYKETEYKIKKLDKIKGLIFKDPVIIFSLLATITISIVITFTSSIYMKIIVDQIIPSHLNRELFVISLVFIWLGLLKAFNLFVKKYFIRKLTVNVNYNITFIYINKISNANIHDLNKIPRPDHIRRLSLIESVSVMLANVMFVIFADVIMLFTSIGILFWLSTKLFTVVLITAMISISLTVMFNLFIKDEYNYTIQKQKKYFSTSIEVISSYEKLKEKDYLNYTKEKFRRNYIQFKKSESKIFWYKTFSMVWEVIVDSIAPIVITFIATKLVFNNNLTVGSMIMFVSLFRTFLNPLDSIATTFLNVPIGLKNFNLLKFILILDDEKLNKKGYILPLVKSIKLENIAFGFDRTIFKIKKFNIKNNIKISGTNGIGKTNFMRLLSGRHSFEGKYFINKIELPFINKKDFRNRIYFSDQEYIPDISIYEFITLLDPIKAKIFSQNIIKYKLQKIFQLLNLDLSKTLFNNASNVSGGQLQVIKLLRLFTKQYDIILLDEATDNITKDIINVISKPINSFQKGIFIEISHNNKYISSGKEVKFEKIIKS